MKKLASCLIGLSVCVQIVSADTEPPTLVSAETFGSMSTIKLTFSEAIFEETATALTNYHVSNEAIVTGATLISSNVVQLTTTPRSVYAAVPKSSMLASASSELTGWGAANAINGSLSMPGWHSDAPDLEEWLRLDLGSQQSIRRADYYPRPDFTHGTFGAYEIYVTDSASDFPGDWGTPAASGTWSYPPAVQSVEFPERMGRYVIFRRITGYAGWAMAGEVWAFSSALSGSQTVTVNHVRDNAGNTIAPDSQATLVVSTTTDTEPPTLVSAETFGSMSTIKLTFSEAIFEETATTLTNYHVSNEAIVTGATLISSNVVQLTTTPRSVHAAVPKSSMLASASSELTGWGAANAINGSLSMPGWHSDAPDLEEWLRLDLGSQQSIRRADYYPRPDFTHGTFGEYEIYVTDSASDFPGDWGTPAASGTWSYPPAVQSVEFPEQMGRYVIFRRITGYAGWAMAGEVWAFSSTPAGSQQVTVNNVRDLAGNTIAPDSQATLVVSTTTDTEPPTLVSAETFGSMSTIRLTFSEAIFEETATALTNYHVSNEAIVTGATLISSNVVQLTTTPRSVYAAVPKSSMLASASSELTGWGAANAINGSLSMPGWHSDAPDLEEWLRLDLGSQQSIRRADYYPRPDFTHGTFGAYEIYVTDSASDFPGAWGTPAASGTWSYPPAVQSVEFPERMGRYVIFRRITGYAGWAMAGEVWAFSSALSGSQTVTVNHVRDNAGNTIAQSSQITLNTGGITLNITRSGNEITISWPAAVEGAILEKALNLQGAAWESVPGQPQTNGASRFMTLSLSESSGFFRLKW